MPRAEYNSVPPNNTISVTDTWARSHEFGPLVTCGCGNPATVAHIRQYGKGYSEKGYSETEMFCDTCSPVAFEEPQRPVLQEYETNEREFMPRFMRVARGRVRKAGDANKTEVRYAEHLERRRLAGEIEWYKFEALKVRLADGTFYTSDFAVLLTNGDLEIHEVKAGRIDKATGNLVMLSEDSSKIKIKIAADMYPFRFIWAIEAPKKIGGGFQFQIVGGAE